VCLQSARQFDRNVVWSWVVGVECRILSWQRSLCFMVTAAFYSLWLPVSCCLICFSVLKTVYCWTRNLSSHIDLHTHVGRALDNHVTFDLRVSACQATGMHFVYDVWCMMLIAPILFLLEHGHTHRQTQSHSDTDATATGYHRCG